MSEEVVWGAPEYSMCSLFHIICNRKLRPQLDLWECKEQGTHFLKSASSLSMSSFESLLLSCLYRAENRAFLSSVPDASLNSDLKDTFLLKNHN